ncbi:DNA-binding transcriptional regulator, LysR family [Duganella sp. CF402]|uniref:LysR substrate-binding domain-containing protein n=1 Tax=unclassified Duganella TaxID=2636909 RepID=UPI0008CDF048|nr:MULTISPECIES: LysR substrate-binding domain-containing protein [unclassified Duganella]RZT08234.1 DNA-binding transcriptional LysR family regulator [Duganella sp. BK701]SEM01268.1 DNA-binding transcriptional regulator, LysR family [Duganella sp. CF402]
MHFDMTDLRLFVAVAETNNLTRGAERCHLSPASVSVRIKNIEESLGARLFVRSSQGVTLTAPGQAFVHHARIVLAQLEHLRNDVQEYGRGIKGHLRLVASITAIAEYLPAALGSYLASHPDVSIDLKERPSPEVVRAVCDGKADLGIVAGPVRTESLEVKPYKSDRLVLVVPNGHALAGTHAVRFRDTLDFDYVCLPEGTGLYAFLMQQLTALDRTIKMRVQIGSFEACCRMIEEHVGIGIIPLSAASRLSRQMAVCVVDLADDWAVRQLSLCARNFDLLPAFARELVDVLVADSGTPS